MRPIVLQNGVSVGIESFGHDDAPLVLLAGGTTMLSWPDSLCEHLAAGGRRVVRYDLRDSGESTTADPECLAALTTASRVAATSAVRGSSSATSPTVTTSTGTPCSCSTSPARVSSAEVSVRPRS